MGGVGVTVGVTVGNGDGVVVEVTVLEGDTRIRVGCVGWITTEGVTASGGEELLRQPVRTVKIVRLIKIPIKCQRFITTIIL